MKIIGLTIIPINNNGEPLTVLSHDFSNKNGFRMRNLIEFYISKYSHQMSELEIYQLSFSIHNALKCYYVKQEEYISAIMFSRHYEKQGYYIIEKLKTFLDIYYKKKMNNYLGLYRLMESFIYTQELPLEKLQIVLKPPLAVVAVLAKEYLSDFLVKDRFVNVEDFALEKNMIANVPLKYGKKIFVKEDKEKIIKKFSNKFTQIKITGLNNDENQSDFFENAKRINYKLAFQRNYEIPERPIILKSMKKRLSFREETEKQKIYKNHKASFENQINNNTEKYDNVKLSLREKVFVTFKASKIINLSIEGQVILNGILKNSDFLMKLNEVWQNSQKVKTKLSQPPNGVTISKLKDETYKVRVNNNIKPMISLIDYILNPDQLKYNQIPILFVYSYERVPANTQIYNLKITYKVNNNINFALKSLTVNLLLHPEVSYQNIKTMPQCHSLKNNQIIWLASEIKPKTQGALIVSFLNVKAPQSDFLKTLFISFQIPIHVNQEMDAILIEEANKYCTISASDPITLLQYKIVNN